MRREFPKFGAVLVLALASAAPAFAFSTVTMNNSNADGSAKFVDPDEQLPFGNASEDASGNSVYVFKGSPARAATGKEQSGSSDQGVAWSAELDRLLFGPANRDVYSVSRRLTP